MNSGRALVTRTASQNIRLPPFLRFFFGTLIISSVAWPRYLFVNVAGFGVNPYTFGVVALTLCCAFLLLFSPALARQWLRAIYQSGALVFFLTLYALVCLVSSLMGVNPSASTGLWLRDTIYLSLIFIPASVFFLDKRCVDDFAKLIFFSIVFVSLIGIGDAIVGDTIVNSIGVLNWAAGDKNLLDQAVRPEFRDGVIRAQSVFAHPIVFGQLVAALFPIPFLFWKRGHILQKFTYSLCTVAMAFAIYFTIARSPLLSALLSVSIWVSIGVFSKLRSSPAKYAIFAVSLCVGLAVLSFDLFSALIAGRTETEISSSQARVDMLLRGIEAVAYRPFLGYGAGQSAVVAGTASTEGVLTIDNLYLSEAIDAGLVGLAFFSAFLTSVMLLGLRIFFGCTENGDRRLVGLLIGTVIALVGGQFVLSIKDNLAFVYLISGMLVAMRSVIQ